MKSDILICICARGGSKGIPGKNLKLLNGKPLIDYTVNFVNILKKSLTFDLYISTDDEDIQNHLINSGINVPKTREKSLALDETPKIDVIRDVLKHSESLYDTKYEHIIDLDVTSPLRNQKDVLSALTKLKNNPEALNIFSVNKSRKNPYFNMIEAKENGYFEKVIKMDNITGRQQAPIVYELNASFYIMTRKFLLGSYKKMVTEKSLIYDMPHICFDIDEPEDFELMEAVVKNNLFQF